jgi:ABC-2 type transport system ATP-binding protein
LSHEPKILFLDEPTAGVDVELRKDMWAMVEKMRQSGVTIILTTHYIEEAEAIADRIGVLNKGELMLLESKRDLMQRLGTKQLIIELQIAIPFIPDSLNEYALELSENGEKLTYTYDTLGGRTGITRLLQSISNANMALKDLHIKQSSLEDIFVDIVGEAQ